MLPQSYPNYKTVHRRFQHWCRQAVLRKLLCALANELRERDQLDEQECFMKSPAGYPAPWRGEEGVLIECRKEFRCHAAADGWT